MEVTKLISSDQGKLNSFKWNKSRLGVIHPEHTPVVKLPAQTHYSELQVSSATIKINELPPRRREIPAHLLSFTSKSPKRATSSPVPKPKARYTSKRTIENLAAQVLFSLPAAVQEQSAMRRLSLISGKDLRKSIDSYSTHLERLREECKGRHLAKINWESDTKIASAELTSAFESSKIAQEPYQEFAAELAEITETYKLFKWKEKVLLSVLDRICDELCVDGLQSAFSALQIYREREILEIQDFLLDLKERCQDSPLTSEELLQVLRGPPGRFQHEALAAFTEKILKSVGFSSPRNLQFSGLEQCLLKFLEKWEKEKTFLESFLSDIIDTFCYEFNLTKEALGPKMKSRKELERKVIAEFLNQYLEKLHSARERSRGSLQKLRYRLEHGREMPKSWRDFVREGREQPGKDKARGVGAERPVAPKPKTNVGKHAQKFPAQRNSSNMRLSLKNPLDFSQKKDAELDDLISALNPSKFSQQPHKSPPQAKKFLPEPTKSPPPTLKHKSPEFNPFKSIDFSANNTQLNPQKDSLYSRVMELKTVKERIPHPSTRSGLIQHGLQPFSPYMDRDGSIFAPETRFLDISAKADQCRTDLKFIEEMAAQCPRPSGDWATKPHHLRSVTNHPFSVNDDPSYYKGKTQLQFKHIPSAAILQQGTDPRENAVADLERTLEDLKCELHHRKRLEHLSSAPRTAQGWQRTVPDGDRDSLVLGSYEAILSALREREKEFLNMRRHEMYEESRPPQEQWYELKDKEFSKELHRNRMNLAPSTGGREFLSSLMHSQLY